MLSIILHRIVETLASKLEQLLLWNWHHGRQKAQAACPTTLTRSMRRLWWSINYEESLLPRLLNRVRGPCRDRPLSGLLRYSKSIFVPWSRTPDQTHFNMMMPMIAAQSGRRSTCW